MKRYIKAYLTTILLLQSSVIPAASPDECAIWMCLPVGFAVPGCGAAHSAMIDRLLAFKGPVPSFGSCSVDSEHTTGIQYSVKFSFSALIGSYHRGSVLARPERFIVPGFCNHRDSGPEEPLGCTVTLNTIRLYENGVQMGMTYHRNKQGTDYIQDPVTGEITSLPGT